MKKLVIYTSLVGNIDKLNNPLVVFEDCDYICFSNNIKSNINNSVWKIKPIPFNSKDSRVTSRFAKILPHRLLEKYEYSLWIDSNLIIQNFDLLQIINKHISDNILISLIKHPIRDCIYDEAAVCIIEGKVNVYKVNKLLNTLTSEGFPTHFGLFENGLMLRKHSDPNIIKLNEEWWKVYLNFVKRDQLSLCYLLWKFNVSCVPFFENGISVRNTNIIKYYHHNISFLNKLKIKNRILLNKILLSIR